MRAIRVHSIVAGRPAAATYRTLARATAPERELNLPPEGLRWVEETTFDPERHQIHFRHQEGAPARLDGSWSCVDDGADAAVTFAARLELGDPREPVLVERLVDDVVAQLARLFPGRVRVDDVVIQVHHPVGAV